MYAIYITYAVLTVTIMMLISNRISYTAIALAVPLLLYGAGILTPGEITAGLINSGVLLCAAMTILGGAILSSGLAEKLGTHLLRLFHTEKSTMLILMITCILLSSFLSNMGTAAIITPIALGICQSNAEYRPQKLLMSVAIGCTMGGMNTMIGTPVNLLMDTALEEAGYPGIGFFDFAKTGIPLCVMGLLYMYLIGYRLCPGYSAEAPEEPAQTCQNKMAGRKKQWITGIVFAGVIISMVLENVTNIPVYISAFAGVLILLITGTISEKQLYQFVALKSIFLVAGLLPLATAMTKSGAADMLARGLVTIIGEQTSSAFIMLSALFGISFLLTQFMANTAAISLLLPIGLSVAQASGISYTQIVMAIGIAAQCAFATPVATPHNTYISGITHYRFTDFLKIGLPLSIGCFLVAMWLIPVIWA